MKLKLIFLLTVVSVIALFKTYDYSLELDRLADEMKFLYLKCEDMKLKDKMLESVIEDLEISNLKLRNNLNEKLSEIYKLKSDLSLANDAIDKYNLAIKENNLKPVEKRDLTIFDIPTEEELNKWISEKAPEDSPFINNAKIFLDASKESGLSPKYIIAHAAVESNWGKSNICINKGNYFGIGVFNHNTNNGYMFINKHTTNTLETGIIKGAMWINENYTQKGQSTLYDMIYGNKSYSVYNDGTPNQDWIIQISQIMEN